MAKQPTNQTMLNKAGNFWNDFNKVHVEKGYFHGTAKASGLGKLPALIGDSLMLLPRAVGRVWKGLVGELFHGSVAVGKVAGKGLGHFLMQPLVGLGKFAKGGFDLARKNPIAAGVVLAGTGAYAWSQHERHAAINATQEGFAAAATGAPMGNYNYMNSVSPAEAAQMEAAMKQGGQGGGFAASQAERMAQGATVPSV